MRRALLLLLLPVVTPAFAQMQGRPDVVLTAKRALILGDPVVAVDQTVTGLSFSPDGRYLVATRSIRSTAPISLDKPMPEPTGSEMVVWDSVTGQSRALPLPKGQFDGMDATWFAGTSKAIVEFTSPIYDENDREHKRPISFGSEAFLFDAATAKMTRIKPLLDLRLGRAKYAPSLDGSFVIEITSMGEKINPTKAIGESYEDQVATTLRMVFVDGKLGKEIQIPAIYSFPAGTGWSQDGREFLIEMRKAPEQRGAFVPVIVHFNPADGSFYDTTGAMAQYKAPEVETDVVLEQKTTVVETDGVKVPVLSWWLRSKDKTERPAAMIVGDSAGAMIAPGEKFVAYVSGRTIFVRQVIELSAEHYLQMTSAAKRAELISNAKQAALAAMMFAGDNDDTLPAGLDPKVDLYPYVKNMSVLQDFVMVFPGGDLNKVKDPANTVLGYIDGPGGRAVAYIDGHVMWQGSGGD
jgi:hypothetical protein